MTAPLNVTCPRCGRAPGYGCIDLRAPGVVERGGPHRQRVEAGRAAGPATREEIAAGITDYYARHAAAGTDSGD